MKILALARRDWLANPRRDLLAGTVEALAQQRLVAAERHLARRPKVTLGQTGRAFWRYPSPWMIAAYLLAAVVARLVVGDWSWSDLLAPAVFQMFSRAPQGKERWAWRRRPSEWCFRRC